MNDRHVSDPPGSKELVCVLLHIGRGSVPVPFAALTLNLSPMPGSPRRLWKGYLWRVAGACPGLLWRSARLGQDGSVVTGTTRRSASAPARRCVLWLIH